MPMPFRPLVYVLALGLLLGGGCRRQVLNDERTVLVQPGQLKSFPVDAPAWDEKVTVTVSSPGVPVGVYMVPGKVAEDAIDSAKPPATSLAFQEKAEQATIEATVPAKTAFAVVLHNAGANPAQVKMTIKGR
jgi:hypothetical protein